MVVMTVGLRTVMTICAVALVDAMPSNRTSIGAALNDTAQEVGTSVGTAVVGTLIAVLVTTPLPAGTWSSDLVASFFHGERITYAVLAVRRRPGRGRRRAHPHRLARHGGAGAGLRHDPSSQLATLASAGVFDHVPIAVSDLAASERFYRTVLVRPRRRAQPRGRRARRMGGLDTGHHREHPVTAGSTSASAPRPERDAFWQAGVERGTATRRRAGAADGADGPDG